MNIGLGISGRLIKRRVRNGGPQIVNPGRFYPILLIAILLAASLSITPLAAGAEQQWSAELLETADYLVHKGQVHMSGNTSCTLHSRKQNAVDAFQGSDVTALLNVASHIRIYLFLHGFYVNPRDGKPTIDKVRADWRSHINLIGQLDQDFAVCLFRHDTAAGFGDHQPNFGNVFFSLLWLTDDPD